MHIQYKSTNQVLNNNLKQIWAQTRLYKRNAIHIIIHFGQG